MRKIVLLLSICLAFAFNSFAQNYTLKGTVVDSLENRNLENSVVSLLRAKDSVLVSFARSDKQGNFTLSVKEPGQYLILMTHPYMGDYFEDVTINPSGTTDLGKVFLTSKSKLLEEVVVRSGSPIRVKGDTTIYTLDSFKVRPGASVEEALRRLPGVTVDKEGNITALGEKVTKVLVDGEEFFGTDPGIATKNIRADAVKEVQIFDKKSDQAEFTGIDDGVKDRTINIKMKKNAGYFGKIELAGGLKDKFSNAAMGNFFKNKQKIAFYGMMSNTGRTGLNWQESQNYGGGGGGMMMMDGMEGAGIVIMGGSSSATAGSQGGIPTTWNGGVHFSDKYGIDQKQSFNTGYKINKTNTPSYNRTYSQTYLPDSSWNSNSLSNNYNSSISHALNGTFDFFIDSANTLKLTLNGDKRNTKSINSYLSEALALNGDSINYNNRTTTGDSENSSFRSSLLWRHKFKKAGRTLSVNNSYNYSKTESDDILKSVTNLYQNGTLFKQELLDQQNLQDNTSTQFTTRWTYTEPLSKKVFMEASYSYALNSDKNDRVTNQINPITGKYENFIDTLSLAYQFDRNVHTPGLSFRLNETKFNAQLGASVGFNKFKQRNNSNIAEMDYSFVNFFPRASMNYRFKPNESLGISYNGSTAAPSLQQLQPIRINTDPLNEYLGNPDLDQSFTHNINLNYNFYNVLENRGFFSWISGGVTDNAFVQSSQILAGGKRTYQTVNASGIKRFNYGADYNFQLPKSKIRLGFGTSGFFNQSVSYVNLDKNISKNSNYSFNLNINRDIPEKLELMLSPSFGWNNSKSTINTAANAKFWSFTGRASTRVYLPLKFDINTDFDWEIRQKDKRFPTNNNYGRWDLFLTKRFAKSNAFEAKFGIYDILNQNRGYNRNFGDYNFTETYYTTLKRFWLVTLTWNFSQNGKPTTGF